MVVARLVMVPPLFCRALALPLILSGGKGRKVSPEIGGPAIPQATTKRSVVRRHLMDEKPGVVPGEEAAMSVWRRLWVSMGAEWPGLALALWATVAGRLLAPSAAWAADCRPYLSQGGYCTNYAHSRAQPPWGIKDAKLWVGLAQQHGWPTNQTPAPGAIAVFPRVGGYGHVAIVEEVRGSRFVVSEMNWGSITDSACAVTENFGQVTQRELGLGDRGGVTFLHQPGTSFPTAAGRTPLGGTPFGQRYRDGALLRAHGQASVYVVMGGQRHGVPDEATFHARGYQWRDVKQVSLQELSSIPEGDTLPRVGQSSFGGPGAGDPPPPARPSYQRPAAPPIRPVCCPWPAPRPWRDY